MFVFLKFLLTWLFGTWRHFCIFTSPGTLSSRRAPSPLHRRPPPRPNPAASAFPQGCGTRPMAPTSLRRQNCPWSQRWPRHRGSGTPPSCEGAPCPVAGSSRGQPGQQSHPPWKLNSNRVKNQNWKCPPLPTSPWRRRGPPPGRGRAEAHFEEPCKQPTWLDVKFPTQTCTAPHPRCRDGWQYRAVCRARARCKPRTPTLPRSRPPRCAGAARAPPTQSRRCGRRQCWPDQPWLQTRCMMHRSSLAQSTRPKTVSSSPKCVDPLLLVASVCMKVRGGQVVRSAQVAAQTSLFPPPTMTKPKLCQTVTKHTNYRYQLSIVHGDDKWWDKYMFNKWQGRFWL